MKRIFAVLIMTLLSAGCAASAPADGKAPARDIRASKLLGEIKDEISKKESVYLYLYADSYKESRDDEARIKKLAESEKAGFYSINAEDAGLEPISDIYNIAFVPTVVRLERGAGVVEKFEGRKSMKYLTAERKKKKQNDYIKTILKNSEKGTSTLLEFYADWCSPCVEMMPMLEELEKKSGGKLDVIRIHVDQEEAMRTLYNVDAPPANILIDTDGVPRLRVSSSQLLTRILAEIGIIE